ncbi:6-phosphofructokinase, alpha subunit [Phlyctochytrium bullatum]|nr:6-phosphofructokinase, alpha subunit [Phlyctochytrium bullatum]
MGNKPSIVQSQSEKKFAGQTLSRGSTFRRSIAITREKSLQSSQTIQKADGAIVEVNLLSSVIDAERDIPKELPKMALAFSHMALVAPDDAKFEAAVLFYSSLGFRTLSRQSSEVWLQLFASSETADLNDGITLRIAKNNRSSTAGSIRSDLDAALKDSKPEDSLGSFVIADLEAVASSLERIGTKFSRRVNPVPHVIVYDPLGNQLTFSEKPLSPFAHGNHSPMSAGLKPKLKFQDAPSASVDSLVNLENYLPVSHQPASTPLDSNAPRISKRIGILTSGGDSSGMNAAVRAITRVALQRGCIPYGIYEGYEGLVEGGEKIKRLSWDDVKGLLSIGGTAIGTARSQRFRTREGRLKAAFNMIKNGIDALVVIGGDGSLTGADKLRSEWQGLCDELVSTERRLALIGFSCLNVHLRLTPENMEMIGKKRCVHNRKIGNRKTIVIVCEGAIDRQLKPINPEYIKAVIEKKIGLDTRVTTLGHATVQGVEAVEAVLRSTPETPSPMIGMSQNKITAGPLMDAVKLTKDVAEAISQKDFKKAMELRDPDFTAAYDAYIESHILSTGKHVKDSEKMRIGIIHMGAPAGGMNSATRVAARVCLNRGHVPLGIRNGFSGLIRGEIAPLKWQELIGWQVKGGSELGTNRDHPRPPPGGIPGAEKIKPKGERNFIDSGLIAFCLQKYNIQGLLIIGGFEAYTSLLTLSALRQTYPAFCIPMVHLPATISNNVPGTDFSIGSDTALNAIVESCDRIKLSATASQKRVFVVEVQGGNCGYLAVLAGLAAGATNVYIPEEGITIDTLQKDIKQLCRRFSTERPVDNHGLLEGRVILRSELASADTYSTDTISSILRAEGKGFFDSRTSVLGHLQQGGVPSPLDRIRASRLAVNCVDWLEGAFRDSIAENAKLPANETLGREPGYTSKEEHACVIGIQGARVVFSPVAELVKETDMVRRRGKGAWWMGFTRLIRVLSKYYYHEDEEMSTCVHATTALNPPTASSRVHKDECTQCFDSQDSELGVDVCLTCFNGGCRDAERAHSKLHYEKFKHPLVLNMKRTLKPRRSDEPPQKITKLAIQEESEEEKYDLHTTIRCFACGDVEVDAAQGNLKVVSEGVKSALSSKKQSDIKAWEEEITACIHTKNVQQGEAKKLDSSDMAHCNDCDLKENLWLCMICGNLGCGRQQYGGLGGNGHGVNHYQATGHAVSVKLGTITPEGTADIYCYLCDEERLDPHLGEHLSTFGINILGQQKTEKSIAELQLEQNLKFDFSMTTEDGKDLTPLFGPSYTGLKNLGNTTTKFATFPKFLVTPMSRFVIGSDYVMKKLTIDINAPLTLDLTHLRSTGLQPNETPFPEEAEVNDEPQVDVEALSQILAMGFPEVRARKALLKTGNNGAEVAMAWLFEHMDDPDIDDPIDIGGGASAEASEAELSQLMDMGFTLAQAKKAMKETNNSLERAVDWLFNHGHEMVDDEMVDSSGSAGASSTAETQDSGPAIYELHAFISHRGPSAHCGHYVAHVKIDGKWVLFNDNKVVEADNVEKAAKEAYVFFYKRA